MQNLHAAVATCTKRRAVPFAQLGLIKCFLRKVRLATVPFQRILKKRCGIIFRGFKNSATTKQVAVLVRTHLTCFISLTPGFEVPGIFLVSDRIREWPSFKRQMELTRCKLFIHARARCARPQRNSKPHLFGENNCGYRRCNARRGPGVPLQNELGEGLGWNRRMQCFYIHSIHSSTAPKAPADAEEVCRLRDDDAAKLKAEKSTEQPLSSGSASHTVTSQPHCLRLWVE
mmetsp:Transcript_100965/g.162888  ORF Transcript_100965/g.162888 Transcript_100965/m.162888 type:complete len:230 (-) Transcript_100965:120-809(-)